MVLLVISVFFVLTLFVHQPPIFIGKTILELLENLKCASAVLSFVINVPIDFSCKFLEPYKLKKKLKNVKQENECYHDVTVKK